jgi:aconitate hydratase
VSRGPAKEPKKARSLETGVPTFDPNHVRETVRLGDETATIYRVERVPGVVAEKLARRPRTTRIVLENVLRHAKEGHLTAGFVALANGEPAGKGDELAFYPERVLLQDFTGVPVIVDLATLRSAAERQGIDPQRIDPVVPVDLIVDHSVQVDSFGSPLSIGINLDREYERNAERYRLLRWAKGAYGRMRIVPPGNGICHQVNLEYLASVVTRSDGPGGPVAYPDTVVGTDSHTTMVNGLSVLGWGVGGIEAEAVLLGEPYYLPRPVVVGVELTGTLPAGATATDLVLTVTRRLREKGVVDRHVEFFGPGVRSLSGPDRATVSNMCPEYGATSALFPIDEATIDYLRGSGRDEATVRRVEAYARSTGTWGSPARGDIDYDDTLVLDLGTIVPTVAGPRNPEESVPLPDAPRSFQTALSGYRAGHPKMAGATGRPVDDGSVVIAAITSCTNTSNPSVMVGAGLLARNAVAAGLTVPPWVKTSLAPGSKVVTDYLGRAGLLEPLAKLGFAVVGFGCTTCIGNSGPLPPDVAKAVAEDDLFVAAVLSGNRNFEARVHNQVRANYLASPMLVVAYALAGRVDVDLAHAPVGHRPDGTPVTLRELWPPPEEVARVVAASLAPSMFRAQYRAIEVGDAHWESLDAPTGALYPWSGGSTYVAEAPFLRLDAPWRPTNGLLVENARALLLLGDKVSTDHISPAGEIAVGSPAADFLSAHGVAPVEFNTYGARRGHHEVMVRGTFANVRLRNEMVAPKEGGFTLHLPDGAVTSVFDAATRYRSERVPLIVLAGKSYGQGSSRDWAAKGPRLLGVGVVIAESYERIHRSNLVEMGVLPLQFRPGEGWKALGLTGRERFSISLAEGSKFGPGGEFIVRAQPDSGAPREFRVAGRIQSEAELAHYESGGILPYVMHHRFSR